VEAESKSAKPRAPRVVVAGGGIAGLEAVLALRELTDGGVDLTLVSAEPELTYRPLMVNEPFTAEPAQRTSLGPAMEELAVGFELGELRAVDPDSATAILEGGRRLGYEYAVVCTGARLTPAFETAHTLWVGAGPDSMERILEEVDPDSGVLSLIVPPGVSWPLPLYEVALITAHRLHERGSAMRLRILSPEDSPLAIFGNEPSAAVGELLEAREIEFHGSTWVREEDGRLVAGGAEHLELGGPAVALPLVAADPVEGLPTDEDGFIPVDEHSRVEGLENVYAAGDGIAFPVKQGGIAAQQADSAAEHIASRIGTVSDPEPFRPVLRGKLLTGDESLHMRAAISGGEGEPSVSPDYLWWPPHKISGRYLAPWLAGESLHADLQPPEHGIDIEVGLPAEWHGDPIALDRHRGPEID
jgi:sulfide:quinone oxidoreductase